MKGVIHDKHSYTVPPLILPPPPPQSCSTKLRWNLIIAHASEQPLKRIRHRFNLLWDRTSSPIGLNVQVEIKVAVIERSVKADLREETARWLEEKIRDEGEWNESERVS